MLNIDITIVTLEYKPIIKRLELIEIYLFRFILLPCIVRLIFSKYRLFNPYNQANKYNTTQNDHSTNKRYHIAYGVSVFLSVEQYN